MEEDVEPSETMLLLSAPSGGGVGGRPRSYSHSSTVSVAPSLVQTVFPLFQWEEEDDAEADDDDDSPSYLIDDHHEERSYLAPHSQDDHHTRTGGGDGDRRGGTMGRTTARMSSGGGRGGFFSVVAWRRYFCPMTRKAYYSSLLHLTLITFLMLWRLEFTCSCSQW
jgi:hypothetical protein